MLKNASTDSLPATACIKKDPTGSYYIEGFKCSECHAVYLGQRNNCSRCFTRDRIEPVQLSNRGKLYTYAIVYRSYPGVEVPYVSAVVDLEDGGTIKGNLIGVEPKPEAIAFDMPVTVVFGDALGRKDADGNDYVSYFFQPVTS
ncbi:MAG: Zn-ribbon domain-containing OB-fold protein [Gammaproteobacteria bacterium]